MKHLTSATGSSGQLIIWDYQLRRINKNEPQKKSLKIINKTYQGKNNQSMKGEGCCIWKEIHKGSRENRTNIRVSKGKP